MHRLDFIPNLVVLLLTVMLFACTSSPRRNSAEFLASYGFANPRPESFKLCYAHTCQRIMDVAISKQEWQRVRSVFEPASVDASMERRRIEHAVGLMESIVGDITGTSADIGGSFPGTFRAKQMDCVDEAVNTSTYLTLMTDDGLILFHDIEEPDVRGHFIFGLPHRATVIVDRATGAEYAVDSWFKDNGHPAYVVPLDTWKDFWHPPKTKS